MWHRQSPETLQGLQAASRRQCRGEASRVRFLVSRGVRQSCLHYAVTTYAIKVMSLLDFPRGPVAENPPDNAVDMGLIPGPGRSHILRIN